MTLPPGIIPPVNDATPIAGGVTEAPPVPPPNPALLDPVRDLRKRILDLDNDLLAIRKAGMVLQGAADVPEVIANLTLAHRHLEDARMRLGKAIQAWDGGTSIYGS